jgi:hypothetical protein
LGAVYDFGVCKEENLPPASPTRFIIYLNYPPRNRTYYLAAESKDDLEDWLSVMKKYSCGVGTVSVFS